MEFLSREAGQRRRAWLDALFAPLDNAQGFDRIATIGDMLNPVSDIGRAGVSARTVFDPSATTNERIGATGAMLTDMASVLAPGIATDLAARAGGKTSGDAVRAITEALAGFSAPADDAVMRFAGSQAGSVGSDPIAARGDEILDMLTSGRASEVTDEMLDLGDPVLNARLNQYLFNNYDLPMDAQSRMARAGEMGFDRSGVHGTWGDNTNFQAFDDRAVYMSDNPNVSATYMLDRDGMGTMLPLEMRAQHGRATIDAAGGFWNTMPASQVSNEPWAFNLVDEAGRVPSMLTTRDVEQAARLDGLSGAEFLNVIDNGLGGAAGNRPGASNVTVAFHPNQVRSRFARFDPRLAHLRNLSAGAAGAALMGDYLTPDQREAELRAYLGM